MTASVGFRSPKPSELAGELLARLAEDIDTDADERLYRDPGQPATATPAALPPALHDFAAGALQAALREPQALARVLGEWLSEPKPQVWFEAATVPVGLKGGVRLDRRTRMLYDARHLFINGEAFDIGGRDARLLRRLADQRHLSGAEVAMLSADARGAVADWAGAGWLKEIP